MYLSHEIEYLLDALLIGGIVTLVIYFIIETGRWMMNLKDLIEGKIAYAVASINFGDLMFNAISTAITDFDTNAFVDQYGDAIADKVLEKFQSDEQALDALLDKILERILG